MIKDKITPEIKERIKEEIRLSGERDKERGFLLCENATGKFFISESCEGTKCNIPLTKFMKDTKSCPKIIGNFHTHPLLKTAKDIFRKSHGYDTTDEELRLRAIRTVRMMHEAHGIKGITSIQTPSHTDLSTCLENRCIKDPKITTCIGTDIDNTKIECWTAKEIPTKDYSKICGNVLRDMKISKIKRPVVMRKWMIPLFDREVISLK